MHATMAQATSGQSCAGCGERLAAGDRFCGTCGGEATRPTAAVRPAALGDGLEPLADACRSAAAPRPVAAASFCRACGADHAAGATACPACDRPVSPPRATGPDGLGAVHVVRRKLLKRSAVRIGSMGTTATLLLESGETLAVEGEALPPEAASPVPDDVVGGAARTTPGILLRLAHACATGAVKAKWQPQALIDAAVDAIADVDVARSVAVDVLAIGCTEVLDRLPLPADERTWLHAVHAARTGDHAAVVAAVAQLPPDRYRAKLDLLLGVWREALQTGADVAGLEPHLTAFADTEPAAALLQRVLGFAPADVGGALATAQAMVDDATLPSSVAREAEALMAALGGEPIADGVTADHLSTDARVLLAHASGASGLVRPGDVPAIAPPILDDLLESGALAPGDALADERSPYVRARLAPHTLSDAEVDAAGHDEERARRAFRRDDDDALGREPDSPRVRHYCTLSALRSGRPQRATLEDVLEPHRPVVQDLLALAQAAGEGTAPSDLLTERMLADATVWPVAVELAGSTGLQPTAALRDRFPAFAEWLALAQARDFLYLGAWGEAVAAADRCLALAQLEDVRDEALSLKACALHHQGLDDLAVAALQQALEGAYSEGLLANMGIVAAGLQPELAAKHLARLVDEAPTIAMRTAAAHRALGIWSVSDTSAWRNSDDSPLPDAFQDALRRLVAAPDLPLDDFRAFAALLAAQDQTWFADPRNIASSPHRTTLEGRFFLARAADLIQMIEVMGSAIAGGSPPAWLLHERDSLREAAVDILLKDLDEPDSTFGSVALAMADHRVLATPYDHLLVTVLGVSSVTYHLSERHAEIADALVERVLDARRQWQALPPDDGTIIEPLVELATRRVAINRMLARDREISAAIDLFNGAMERGQHAPPGSFQYREALAALERVVGIVRAARSDLVTWPPIVDHEAVREDLDRSIAMTRDLERRCLQILN